MKLVLVISLIEETEVHFYILWYGKMSRRDSAVFKAIKYYVCIIEKQQ